MRWEGLKLPERRKRNLGRRNGNHCYILSECQLWTEQAVNYVPLIQKQVGLGLVLRELPVSLLKPTSKRITEMD